MLIKPNKDEYPEYYQFYIDLVPDEEILNYLENQTAEVLGLYQSFDEEKMLYKYEKDKWSIKELLGHLLDTEIIMGYRALTYARKDKSNLNMYDHDEYVTTGHFHSVESTLLIKHYKSVRESNLLLFKTFSTSDWLEKGITGGKNFTARTIPFILAGHTNHHIKVLKEKYL